jgi:hypothetical protein
VDEPDGEDLSPELADLDAYARGYTRDELAGLAAEGRAYYDAARAVWVVQGGPYGSFEISDAQVLDANPADYAQDAYDTRFDGYTRETLNDLVGLGQAVYDQDRGVWTINGENGRPYEVRDVDSSAQAFMAGAGADPPPLEALIDRATIRHDAGQPAANALEGIVFRALSAADAGTGDGSTSWRADLLRQLYEAGWRAWYEVTYALQGRLGNALSPARILDEKSARDVACRMSAMGEQADVALVASDGSRSVIGSYVDQQPLPDPGELVDSPTPYSEFKTIAVGEVPWPEPPPWPVGPIPAAADAAGPPRPAPRATQLQFPQGISPLPVTATSGGPPRPTRLLYPDGTPVDFRPIGNSRSVTATAAGVVPATGNLAPGWLQVIQRENGNLAAVHPALVSPRGINPLAWLPHRELRRFGEFDGAEAAGRDSALLQARFVDQGDSVRTPAGEIQEVASVTALPHVGGVTLTIATAGPPGHASPQEYEGHHTVEVLIPAHHPAEDSPNAGHLFAVPRRESGPRAGDGQDTWAAAEFDDLDATLDWVRRAGSAPGWAGPPGAPLPGRDPGQLPPGMAEALQRGGGMAGLPAGDVTPQQAGWQVSVRMTARMHQVQSAAAAAIGNLAQDPAWLRLRRLTANARRLAADASARRLRFSDPAWALRSWRAVWARVCEMTCDLTAALTTDRLRGPAGRRKGSRPWQAARALHHAAAEGAAHAHGWLPRDVRLPMGSYEIPGRHGRVAGARAKAGAAARRYSGGPWRAGEAAGPLSQLDFPGAVAKVADGARPGRQRAAAAKARHARTAPGRHAPPDAAGARPQPG